jgi:hypothetical protein
MLVGCARTSSVGQVAGLEAQERELPDARKSFGSRCHRLPIGINLKRPSITCVRVTASS